jgi:hypothetical protein
MAKRKMTVDEKLDRLTETLADQAAVVKAQGANLEVLRASLDTQRVSLELLKATVEQQQANLDRLEKVVNTLAATVLAHDDRIAELNKSSARYERIWRELTKQWQAYLNTLPKQ